MMSRNESSCFANFNIVSIEAVFDGPHDTFPWNVESSERRSQVDLTY